MRVGIKAAVDGLKVSVLRTLVPLLVGLLINLAATLNIQLKSEDVTELVTYSITFIGTAIYYVGIRLLEKFKSSKWGWLLGWPAAPVYTTPDKAAPAIEGKSAIVPDANPENIK